MSFVDLGLMRTALKALWIRKSYGKAELKTFTSTVGCRVQRKTDIAKRDGGEGWASHLGGMAGAQVGRQGRKPTTSARDGVQGVARDTCPQTHREPPGKTPRWKPCPSSTASSCAALACFRAGTGAYQPYVSVNTSIALGPERQSRSERHTGPGPRLTPSPPLQAQVYRSELLTR